jgi:competence protein ComEA
VAGRGLRLFVLLLLLLLIIVLGRRAFPPGEAAPAFSLPAQSGGIIVALDDGFDRRGLHQFSDGVAPMDVIIMTQIDQNVPVAGVGEWYRPLQNGEKLQLRLAEDGRRQELIRTFLPAGQRMLLGIPLHPESMKGGDWEALPGVGPKLAAAIEIDRQKNGDFGSIEGLLRVKGVGPRRVEEWRPYFSKTERPAQATVK